MGFHTTNLRWSDLFWRMHLHRGCTCSLIVWGWSQNLIAHNYLFFLIQWIFCTEEQNLSNVLVPDESAESARSSYNSGAGDQYRVEERRLVAVIVCQPWRPPLSVALYPITTKLCPLSDYLVDAVHSYGSALVLIHPFKQFIFLEIIIKKEMFVWRSKEINIYLNSKGYFFFFLANNLHWPFKWFIVVFAQW